MPTTPPEVPTLEAVRQSLAPDLDRLLADLTMAHQAWLETIHAHREAARLADPVAMQRALEAQTSCIARVAELDKERRLLVDRAARLPEIAGTAARSRRGPLTLRDLAAATREPSRSRLISSAEALKTLVEDVKRAGSILQAASASLLAHTEGLMRQVARQLSQAGTYGRRGYVEPAHSLACAVDIVQ